QPRVLLCDQQARLFGRLTDAGRELAPGLTESMVRFAVRHEYARSVEDVLARRSRLLFTDARAASGLASTDAAILREELGEGFDADASAAAFRTLATQYLPTP